MEIDINKLRMTLTKATPEVIVEKGFYSSKDLESIWWSRAANAKVTRKEESTFIDVHHKVIGHRNRIG